MLLGTAGFLFSLVNGVALPPSTLPSQVRTIKARPKKYRQFIGGEAWRSKATGMGKPKETEETIAGTDVKSDSGSESGSDSDSESNSSSYEHLDGASWASLHQAKDKKGTEYTTYGYSDSSEHRRMRDLVQTIKSEIQHIHRKLGRLHNLIAYLL